MLPQWIIEKKRDGAELSEEEIRFIVEGLTDGSIPDYQISAFAMAVYFQGMTPRETACLTQEMMLSGETIDPASLPGIKADKHSTGGIGDKTSLILAPLAAACGLTVPMISGRGLGITGGTLDKLEAIPGFRTDLSEKEFFQTGVKHQDYPKTEGGPYAGITGNQNNMFTYPDNFGNETTVHPNVP